MEDGADKWAVVC